MMTPPKTPLSVAKRNTPSSLDCFVLSRYYINCLTSSEMPVVVARRFARWQAITSGIRHADLVSRVVSLARRLVGTESHGIWHAS
jgi:hypothetical protein